MDEKRMRCRVKGIFEGEVLRAVESMRGRGLIEGSESRRGVVDEGGGS
ncbi:MULTISPECIES: hypothetical protein [Bartonella]|nr:hypothetical protein [Bartonella capreoli]